MATASKSRSSYHIRLFIVLIIFLWGLVTCFITFQYGREKSFKAESLNHRLQMFNTRLIDALADGVTPEKFMSEYTNYSDSIRVTIISANGNIIYDSSGSDISAMGNHLRRHEIRQALATGSGYTIARLSESTHLKYFYAATADGQLVVRSAIPYSLSLTEALVADRHFIRFMLGLTVLMSVIGYFVTKRLGSNITRLREFAIKAGHGYKVDDMTPFPHDELGDISNQIIKLYSELRSTMADRDREHATAMHEEQEKIRIKKQLTNNINHELKTPVASIHGYLETIIGTPDMDAQTRSAFIAKSYAQVERLRSLLNDISAVTRMDEAGESFKAEEANIGEIVEEIAADVALLPEQRRLRINCDFTHPVTVHGNASLLRSIFGNLTDNATAYSGGRDIFISLVSEDGDSYTFSFADNGIGIEEQHLPHIFERFYRIDKGRSRKMGGTGLGLSIVKNAVLLHGGTIEARNRERGGLEFVFTIRKHTIRPDM